jgi:hypothetical protein
MGNQTSSVDNNERIKHSDQLQNFIPPKHRIDRVEKITGVEFMEKYYKAQRPLIITNMASEWPAIQVQFILISPTLREKEMDQRILE